MANTTYHSTEQKEKETVKELIAAQCLPQDPDLSLYSMASLTTVFNKKKDFHQ